MKTRRTLSLTLVALTLSACADLQAGSEAPTRYNSTPLDNQSAATQPHRQVGQRLHDAISDGAEKVQWQLGARSRMADDRVSERSSISLL